MVITINIKNKKDGTNEEKIVFVKERIYQLFKSLKSQVDMFDTQLLKIVTENRLGLTSDEILESFGSEADELNQIRIDLKEVTKRIEIV